MQFLLLIVALICFRSLKNIILSFMKSNLQDSQKPRKTYREPPKNLKIGETVRLLDMDQLATILKQPDNKGMARVQAGILKMDVHISNLERVKDNSTKEITETTLNNLSKDIKMNRMLIIIGVIILALLHFFK